MRYRILTFVLAFAPAASAWAITTTTVSFQKDADGYTDVAEMRISYDWDSTAVPINSDNARNGTDGTAVTNYLIDGFTSDDPVTTPIENSNDEQELIKFGSIIGNTAGQIPAGATILDATLTYRTYDSGTTPPSAGPFGVAALNQPFTTATRYEDFPSSNGNPLIPYRGAWFEDGADQPIGHPYATRPVGAFAGPNTGSGPTATGTNVLNGITNADVWPLVQRWSDDPSSNHGFVVQAGFTGQTNGWGFFTSGSGTVANRPKLSVTYTTDPIGISVFQRDLNGYTGDTVARLSSGADLINNSDDITIDGSTVTGSYYIDESETSTATHLRGLFKFGNVFGAGAGQAPANKTVTKAWLVLTTGLNDDNRSPGPFSVHAMLRDWDVTTLYSSFGLVPGLQEADGDMGPTLDSNYGATNGSESWFDVTSYLEAVRNGTQDFGLAVVPEANDGWGIMLNGATDVSVHPRLVVYSDLSLATVPGDYNGDNKVDASDYVLWRKDPGAHGGTPDGYNAWRSNFGFGAGAGSGSLDGGAVPEPTAWSLIMVATIAMCATSFRAR
jgi:hypothetical protein